MRCKYPERDLSQRLDNSVCMYGGNPVYVRVSPEGGGILDLYDLDQNIPGILSRIKYNDPLFDISTPPLGFIQARQEMAMFVMRRPVRVYKQGLSNENILILGVGFGANFPERISVRSLPVKRMIANNYPTLIEALKTLEESKDNKSIAISRDICLEYVHKNRIIHVYYRDPKEPVGWMIVGTRTVIIPSSENGWVVSKYLSGLTWEVK